MSESKIFGNPYEKSRKKIVEKLELLYPNGIGIEIGVKKGEFSKILLQGWNCNKLYLVDAWEYQDNNIYDEDFSKKDHNDNYNYTINNIKEYSNRVEIIKGYSVEVVKKFQDNFFDFIYIDANHSYEAVKQDLEFWYPKLKNQGLIMGDDYTFENIHSPKVNGDEIFGVKKAVDEFCNKKYKNISLEYTGDWTYNTGRIGIIKHRLNINNKEELINERFTYTIPSRNWYFIK